jgi:phosphoribosylformimino-5-aminoimidazole carboxamide ribotide isomerase
VSAGPASTFEILPAIDLRGGQVVRLRRGDFADEDVFSTSPGEVAVRFAEAGARWLHIVDLDGAREGGRRQTEEVAAIRRAVVSLPTPPRLQVAGGLRSIAAIDACLETGADRIVVGTAALTDPALVRRAIERHGPERIAVALDVRDGLAVGHGWVAGATGVPVADALTGLTGLGVTTFVVTAIARDGLLGGPDLELLAACVAGTSSAVIASGGVTSLEDLRAVRALGCSGAIVGRSVYEGRLNLGPALRELATAG